MSLDIGDEYTDFQGRKHKVSKIYTRNGRKHIELDTCMGSFVFEELPPEEWMTPLTFIEGIGPNVFISIIDCWVLSQYKDDVLSYGLPRWKGYWDFIENVPNTSLEEIPQKSFYLYPNPATTQVKVSLPNYAPANETILAVTDLTGRAVETFPVTANPCFIDVSHYPSGLYLVIVTDKDSRRTNKLIVKQE